MKNKTIRERYAAISALSGRTLPSQSAVNKVSFLLADRFAKPFETTEIGRKKIIAEIPLPLEHEGDNLPPSIAEARQRAVDALMEEETPIRKIPDHMRLRATDMPKVLKGDDGHRNAAGLASIRAALGSLYVKEGDEIVTDQPDGFETDEATESGIDPMAEHTAAE